jgi:uncharacterized protein (UPF0335 family)
MSIIGHNSTVDVNALLPDKKKLVKDAVQEISDSLTRVEAERDLIKNIAKNVYDSTGVDRKVIRKLAKVYHNANFDEESETNDTFESFYTVLFGSPTP